MSWFTGEAVEADDLDIEEDDDEIDEDEDDEEDDEDDEEDDDEDDDEEEEADQGKKSKKKVNYMWFWFLVKVSNINIKTSETDLVVSLLFCCSHQLGTRFNNQSISTFFLLIMPMANMRSPFFCKQKAGRSQPAEGQAGERPPECKQQ